MRVVEDVSLAVSAGETLGIVTPPGPSRVALGRLLAGRSEPDAGSLTVAGTAVARLDKRRREALLACLQIVGDGHDQLPGNRIRVGEALAAAIEAGAAARRALDAGERADAAPAAQVPGLASSPAELLALVGLSTSLVAARIGDLSSRQRRLLEAARVVAVRPALVVLDAPVSSGEDDVSAAIRRVMLRLRDELGTAIVVMASSLDEVLEVSDRIVVLYLGRVMEELVPADLPDAALHPFTHALVSAADPDAYATRIELRGSPGEPGELPSGCVFRTRCFQSQERCSHVVPELAQPLGATHRVACHFPGVPVRGSAPGESQPGTGGSDPRSGEPTGREFAEE